MIFLALPGPTELYVILLVVLLIFGARKLPELARAMGSSINQFKKGLKEEPRDSLEQGGSVASEDKSDQQGSGKDTESS